MRRERYARACRGVVVLLLLTLCSALGLSQESDESVFAPFISRLRISLNDPQVRITWVDAPDVSGSYAIYRSTVSITNETLDAATQIGDAAAGEEAYLDVPDAPGTFYYAVLALTDAGEPYRILIPGRNSSFRPVSIENLATPREEAARITSIESDISNIDGQSAIAVTAQANRDGRNLVVYRATSPIQSIDDLSIASLVTEVQSNQIAVLDLPVPGVGYYYAILDSELLLDGGGTIEPGENATTTPAEIPIQIATVDEPQAEPDPEPETEEPSPEEPEVEEPEGQPVPDVEEPAPVADASEPDVVFEVVIREQEVRAIPLPFLQLQSVLSTGRRLRDLGVLIPDEVTLSNTSADLVLDLLPSLSPVAEPQAPPRILDEDRAPSPEGVEYTLRTIIDGPIERLAWEDALQQLTNFLSLPLSQDLAARAHFYRGQAYYYTGERQLAILEFLLARDAHYVDVEAWLDTVLSAPQT